MSSEELHRLRMKRTEQVNAGVRILVERAKERERGILSNHWPWQRTRSERCVM